MVSRSSPSVALIRYGRIPEVARFRVGSTQVGRSDRVVVECHRGLLLGEVLQLDRSASETAHELPIVVRRATDDDVSEHSRLEQRAAAAYSEWTSRIGAWQLSLELIDLEWTLDGSKLVLYTLNDRNAETTRLALLAAAAGLGIVEVQPVSAEGLLPVGNTGGGCGSCGCG